MPYESTTIEASDDTPLPATATTDLFEKAQATYRLIVASNYLCHTEITREMRRELAAFAACNDTIKTQGISVLDLGCGDCALVARLFDASRAAADGNFQLPQLRKFVGVDLAAAALQVAELTKPFPPSCSVELHQADFFQCFAEAGAVGDQTFDVIVSSFAIHHLPTERKGALLKLIKQRLNPGGLFLGADVVNVVVGRNREATMVAWRPHVLQGEAIR
jgi:SAM-dependent methyltransferase